MLTGPVSSGSEFLIWDIVFSQRTDASPLRLAFGTPALRVDLVDAAIKITPTLSTRGLFSGWFSFPHPNKGGSFAQVKVVGPLASFDYIPRHVCLSSFFIPRPRRSRVIPMQNDLDDTPYSLFNFETPTFANGTTIRKGTYRVLLRALRVTGDPTREEDYESWLSPILGISA